MKQAAGKKREGADGRDGRKMRETEWDILKRGDYLSNGRQR